MRPRATSRIQLRRIALARQGLIGRRAFGSGKRGAERALARLGYAQIDTISVVARAHHHTLWNRVPGYREEVINALLRERKIFEYWFHAAAYLPMAHYRFALPLMRALKRGERHWAESRDKKLLRHVLDRIRDEGPLMARDFEDPRARRSGWWDWKPAKLALEHLFMRGDLMTAGREGFQKRYDLTERVLPADTNVSEPTAAEQAAHLIDVTLDAHGFATRKSFTYGRRGAVIREAVKTELDARIEDGRLVGAVNGTGELFYAPPAIFERTLRRPAPMVSLLSPFDNALIQRERNLSVHDFDYQLECYVPAPKRRFGYFCLPILYRDTLVGRADCKAHRRDTVFEIKRLHVERPVDDLDAFAPALGNAVAEFARFNGCEEIRVTDVAPTEWRDPLVDRLENPP